MTFHAGSIIQGFSMTVKKKRYDIIKQANMRSKNSLTRTSAGHGITWRGKVMQGGVRTLTEVN